MQAGGTWLDGPTEARHPRDTWPASRDFRRRIPDEALLVSGLFTIKHRLHLYELVEEDTERGDVIAKMESAAEAINEIEGNTTDELLRDTAAQEDATGDDAAGHDIRGVVKEIGLEESSETEGDSPEEMSRDTAGRENFNDDDNDDHDLRNIATQDGAAAKNDLEEIYELSKVGLEERGETKGTGPEETPHETLGRPSGATVLRPQQALLR